MYLMRLYCSDQELSFRQKGPQPICRVGPSKASKHKTNYRNSQSFVVGCAEGKCSTYELCTQMSLFSKVKMSDWCFDKFLNIYVKNLFSFNYLNSIKKSIAVFSDVQLAPNVDASSKINVLNS